MDAMPRSLTMGIDEWMHLQLHTFECVRLFHPRIELMRMVSDVTSWWGFYGKPVVNRFDHSILRNKTYHGVLTTPLNLPTKRRREIFHSCRRVRMSWYPFWQQWCRGCRLGRAWRCSRAQLRIVGMTSYTLAVLHRMLVSTSCAVNRTAFSYSRVSFFFYNHLPHLFGHTSHLLHTNFIGEFLVTL